MGMCNSGPRDQRPVVRIHKVPKLFMHCSDGYKLQNGMIINYGEIFLWIGCK